MAAWRYLDHPNVSKFLGIASLFEGRPPGLVSAYMLRNDFLSYVARHPELKMQKVGFLIICSVSILSFVVKKGTGSRSWIAISALKGCDSRRCKSGESNLPCDILPHRN